MPPPLAEIAKRAPDRNAAVVDAHATGGYSYQQIADYFGVHFTTAGRIVSERQVMSTEEKRDIARPGLPLLVGHGPMASELHNGAYSISTDKSRIDLSVVHGFLSSSYWSPGVPLEIVQRAVEHSLCFGI